MSDIDDGERIQPRRKLQKNARKVDSDAEMNDSDGDDESEFGVRTRNARNDKKSKKKESMQKQSSTTRNGGRSLRNRDNRKKYDG